MAGNPIKRVAPYTSSVGTYVTVPVPSVYQWALQDVSDSEAGRTEDTLMHKNRVAQKVKIELQWQNLSTADASTILNAFNSEYLSIEYLDPKSNAFLTKIFYVGDRSAPLYNATMNVWSNISFNIIER